jgi:hypothetical protein
VRASPVVAAAALVTLSCGSSSAAAVNSPSPTLSASPSASPVPSGLVGTFGLVSLSGILELVGPNGSVVTQTAISPSSAVSCAQGMAAQLPSPVSATKDRVFFRDGDTKIRYLAAGGQTGDATTVPGGPTTVSLFSVSPDDQRIAVLVEDLSDPATIKLRMYVEDLNGQGHHVDIYANSTPNGKAGTTMWPMGWHGSQLVMAVDAACILEGPPPPSEWQVLDAGTGARVADIVANNCVLSAWPSSAGVACVSGSQATVYGWDGNVVKSIATQPSDYESAVSPSGAGTLFTTPVAPGSPPPSTRIVGSTASTSVPGHAACLWIDDDHVLAPDAVISFPSGTVTALPTGGACAGRFPGGL